MAEILASDSGRRRPGVRRAKRHNLKVDMTPMVDLGFLLIAFFVMTAELSKPSVVNLNMPKEGTEMPVGESNALTILLNDNSRVYYYHGDWKKAFEKNEIFETNFSITDGIGQVIREKQKWLDEHGTKEKREGLMLLIKGGAGASYQNVIDALDEATINVVKKYAVLPADKEEKEWMDQQNK